MSIKVGYLGPSGTFTHQSAIQQFGSCDNVEYLPLASISACFESVQNDVVDYSMIPLENSSNGQVVFTYDLFRDWFTTNNDLDNNQVPNFRVVSEQFVSIHHNFITFSDDISKIDKIYSHPQVWTQCRKFLKNYELDNSIKIEKFDTSSTSKAVEMLLNLKTEEERQSSAAIASNIASEIHNVPIKIENIEDFSGNTTRFLCLSKHESLPNEVDFSTNKKLHLISFIIKNNDNFGSLCDILQIFKDHNLNLQTITTRPSINAAWRYVFFIEVWDNDTPESFENCIRDLNDLCIDLNIIGSFLRSQKFFDMIHEQKQ